MAPRKKVGRKGKNERQARRPSRFRWYRPRIEALEDRTLLDATALVNPYDWTPLGPSPIMDSSGTAVSGRITGIAVDPTSADTAYVAAAGGGIWKTTDGGQHWTPKTDHLPGLT